MTVAPARPSLTPLLAPRSIAVIGASPSPNSYGHFTLKQILAAGFSGAIYPINPKYPAILDRPCYPSIAATPGPVDLAVLVVANGRIEEQVALCLEHGVRAFAIFASCYLENDPEPKLMHRLAARAREARVPICGANCLGFYNVEAATSASWFAFDRLEPGNICTILHSGSIFISFVKVDPRLRFNLCVSAGQELVTTAADYMHYALDRDSTRCLALFLETVRDPDNFVAALEKARARDVPVVALKVGRTATSARLAQTHSGAIAGDDAAYEAIFDRHGVLRVDTVDELAATAMLMAAPRRAAEGGLAALFDSGGARGMGIDLADRHGVRFADIGAPTVERLSQHLEYGLDPVNPVDFWGSGYNYDKILTGCFQAVMADPDTAAGVLFSDISLDDPATQVFADCARAAAAATAKPVAVALNFSRLPDPGIATRLVRDGIPVLDGTENALLALRHAFDYRDFRRRPDIVPPPQPAPAVIDRWRRRLAGSQPFGEIEGLALLRDFGIATAPVQEAKDEAAAVAAAIAFAYPVALKSAAPGLRHKTDAGGVALGLRDEAELRAAYRGMAARLGPATLVMPMVEPGVEIALGQYVDEQFGPLVTIAAGGTPIELLRDRQLALPPLDAEAAGRLVGRLRLAPMLRGVRGRRPADRAALHAAIARFSVLVRALGDLIAELDVNPLIAGPAGCVAVDALVVPRPLVTTRPA